MVVSNNNIIFGDEYNDYEGIDEEVVSGLLGLTDIHHTSCRSTGYYLGLYRLIR
jgi:hypothetical protein